MTHRNNPYWMWVQACEAVDRADRLQRQFFRPADAASSAGWEPPVDLFETVDALWIEIALPGVAPEHIELFIHGDALVVTGRRLLPAAVRGSRVHRLEIPSGRFERRIALPSGRYELVERQLVNGCLILGLRRRAGIGS